MALVEAVVAVVALPLVLPHRHFLVPPCCHYLQPLASDAPVLTNLVPVWGIDKPCCPKHISRMGLSRALVVVVVEPWQLILACSQHSTRPSHVSQQLAEQDSEHPCILYLV